jgi:hypothetical protein
MNPNPDNELEALIDSELKALPPLTAPNSLGPRIMAGVTAHQSAPWYRNGWQAWPLALRVAALVGLTALFAGLCLAGGIISKSEGVTVASEKVSGVLGAFSVAGKTLTALGAAVLHIVQGIGKGYIVAGLVLVAFAYATCVAFGSFYLRFALGRVEIRNL